MRSGMRRGSGVVVGNPSEAAAQKATTAQVQEQLPLIQRIAARPCELVPRHNVCVGWNVV
jgi:type IV secretory pathway protease TraF